MACGTLALCVALWLNQHGYSPQQRDAVVAYVRQESGFRPDVVVRSGACLMQWAGSRRRAVLALGHGRCPPWRVQMEFADRELRTVFSGFWRSTRPADHMRCHFGMGKRG